MQKAGLSICPNNSTYRKMEEKKPNCELCKGEAEIYCPSDNAFLCYTCDQKVHSANFIVARHGRYWIDGENHTSTTGEEDGEGEEDSLSSSSSCVSSTGEGGDEVGTTPLRKRTEEVCEVIEGKRREKNTVVTDRKVEDVLGNWCRRMGAGVVEEREIGAVVTMAVEVLTGWWERMTSLPFRVSLAAAVWVAGRVVRRRRSGTRLSSSTCQYLKRVEQISGVPAKLIMATEAKLARGIKRRQSREDHEEGWAEC